MTNVHPRRPVSRTRHRGFSLLEVIIATGIMATSSALLLNLLSTGERHASRAETRGMAQMLCQTKLDEFLANPQEFIEINNEPFPGYEDWEYSIRWQAMEIPGLIQLRVSVRLIQPSARLMAPTTPNQSFELIRWARLPEQEEDISPDSLSRQ